MAEILVKTKARFKQIHCGSSVCTSGVQICIGLTPLTFYACISGLVGGGRVGLSH
uniref:Uncharacterized protein n=1 Tax=Octopus bimaculoides TaxID=37653 RepID=A0A0L8FKK0_OCTBM